MNAQEMQWLIWSNEHNAWWGHASHGYTAKRSDAGLYSFAEALEICSGANRFISDGKPPHETMIPQDGNDIKFWAYLHSNGTVQVKRWFGDVKDYTTDCKDNPFVIVVIEPFTAANHEEAGRIAVELIKRKLETT